MRKKHFQRLNLYLKYIKKNANFLEKLSKGLPKG